ncbi:MAG: ATP-binding protein [Acidobacteriaceae bacterium]|nr:ATP-binding protein [Acidobacteriaceae bacterium]
MPDRVSLVSPFPGLRPFRPDEDNVFFGREGQSEAIVRRLRETRFLAVVGVSGSGKSSLIRAGLIAFLNRGYMQGAGTRWRVAIFRPGGDPIGNLACDLNDPAVLGSPGAPSEDAANDAILAEVTLRRSGLGLIEAVRLARLPPEDQVLVIVDQFEELFRFADSPGALRNQDDAAAFVRLLIEATRQSVLPIYVVITMRSEFIGDCARFRDLPEAVTAGLYLIPRLTRDQRRDVIVRPVQFAEAAIAPRLVNRLLNDCGDDPGQLPLLQHSLMRTWDHWAARSRSSDLPASNPIDLDDYLAIGAMSQALSQHADEAYRELPDERHRYLAKRIFQTLVERDSDNREVRRPTKIAAIASIAGASPAEIIATVEYFRREDRSFLMPPPEIPLDAESVIDISHESLIRGWAQLSGWVEEEWEWAQSYRKLAERAADHAQGKAGFLRDPELSLALNWRDQARPNLAWAQRYHPGFVQAMDFLDRSRDARDAEQANIKRGQARERRRLLLFAFTATALFLIAAAAALYAWREYRAAGQSLAQAQRQTRRAERDESDLRQKEARLQASNAATLETNDRLRQMKDVADLRSLQAEAAYQKAAKAADLGVTVYQDLPAATKSDVKKQHLFEDLINSALEAKTNDLAHHPADREEMVSLVNNWVSLIDLHRNQGRSGQAVEDCRLYERKAADFEKSQDYFHRALGAGLLALVGQQRLSLKQKQNALDDVSKAARLAEVMGDPPRDEPGADLAWRLHRSAYSAIARVAEAYQDYPTAANEYQLAVVALAGYQDVSPDSKLPARFLSPRALKLFMGDVSDLARLRLQLKQPQLALAAYSEGIDIAEAAIAAQKSVGITGDEDLVDGFVWLYLARGDAYLSNGDMSSAQKDFESAKADLQLFDSAGAYTALYDAVAVNERLGNVCYRQPSSGKTRQDNLRRALDFHKQALDRESRLAKNADQQRLIGALEIHLARDYEALNDPASQLLHLRNAIKGYTSAKDFDPSDANEVRFAQACAEIAGVESIGLEARRDYLRDAVNALEALDQPDPETNNALANDLKQMGGLQVQLGEKADAIASYNSAIQLMKPIVAEKDAKDPSTAESIDSLFWMWVYKGDAESSIGRYEDAGKSYQAASEVASARDVKTATGAFDRGVQFERIGDFWYARGLHEKDAALTQSDLRKAIDFHAQSLAMFQQSKSLLSGQDTSDEAKAQTNIATEERDLGLDYQALKAYSDARPHYQASIAAYRQAEVLNSTSDASHNVAQAYRRLAEMESEAGDPQGVAQTCEAEIGVWRRLTHTPKPTDQDRESLADVFGVCSWLHLLVGDFQVALDYALQGIDFRDENFIRLNEAHAYLALGKVDKAREIYFKYLDKPLYSSSNSKSFRQGIFDDFGEMRKRPNLKIDWKSMDKIQSDLGGGGP